MSVRPVLLAGSAELKKVCDPIPAFDDPVFLKEKADLHATLEHFRQQNGFGRGIAAVQIGYCSRFIAVNLGEKPFTVINPEIVWKSDETFTMWDDCMSFPWLLVKVRRHKLIRIRHLTDEGIWREWSCNQSESELLQHEIDHLDGVLALERAEGPHAFVAREIYEKDRETFDKLVDYAIVPTI